MHRFISIAIVFAVALLFAREAHSQNKVARSVTNEMLEKALQGLDVKFKKGERKDKDIVTTYYDFNRGDMSVRLFNYNSDLWLETTLEKKMELDQINRWNAQAKFSRLVLIESKDKATLSLEAQLDCLGGVTDASIRQFVNRFDEETKKFVKFVK